MQRMYRAVDQPCCINWEFAIDTALNAGFEGGYFMKWTASIALLVILGTVGACVDRARERPPADSSSAAVLNVEEGFVDANGVLIYYKSFGAGQPLVILHGGPGASHDYFLPYLLPLARTNRLVFIDERGSGRSQQLEDPSGYTVENMADDIEAVRRALALGKISLLGHSYGGVLAEAYAFKYQDNLTHLVLASTFHSTKQVNEVFRRMKAAMAPELRDRIDKMEKAGLFGHGKDWQRNRYSDEYMVASWGEGYFPYLYQRRPDPNYNPTAGQVASWELYRTMWGSSGEFIIDGNLVSVEYGDRLGSIHVPTLITVGDHDQIDPSISRDIQQKIVGSKLVVLPQSGHMTFVDQPGLFLKAVEDFVRAPRS